jgi:hypothetical protein
VSSALIARLTAVPGVRAAIGDVSVPARLGDRAAVAHGWSSAALTSTTLGPSLGADNTLPAQILTGGQGGGLNAGVISGSLNALHGDAIALGRHRAGAARARIGDRVPIMLGDGTRTHATVVAIYTRDLAFGDALLAPRLAASHQTIPLLSEILIQTDQSAGVAMRLQALAQRYPGLRVSDSASLVTATAAGATHPAGRGDRDPGVEQLPRR